MYSEIATYISTSIMPRDKNCKKDFVEKNFRVLHIAS